MSADAIVAIVFAVMFIGGIAVGFITVIAISAVRADQRAELAGPDGVDCMGEGSEQGHCVFGIPGHWDGANDGVNHAANNGMSNGANDPTNNGVSGDDRPLWPGDSSTGQAAE
jgi:hypothetical protein